MSQPSLHLRTFGLFASIPMEVIDIFLPSTTLQALNENDFLFRQGDQADALYAVRSGRISLRVNSQELATRGPGDIIGEQGVLDSTVRSADAMAQAPCVLIRIEQREVIRLASEYPAVYRNLCSVLSAKLREATMTRAFIYKRDYFLRAELRALLSAAAFGEKMDQLHNLLESAAASTNLLPPREEEGVVMFADIRSFSSIAEKWPFASVQSVLNAYFTCCTKIINSLGGSIDKFLGDGVLAFFLGDPKIVAPPALVAAARIVQESQRIKLEGFGALQTGVGLSAGTFLFGQFGSPLRQEFTIIGDTVNAACRLQDLNKQFGSSIIVNNVVKEYCSFDKRFAFGPIAYVQLHNRSEKAAIHTVTPQEAL